MINVIGGLLGQIIGLFGQRGQAAKENLQARISNAQRSWTDEVIALVWFSPLLVAWFSKPKAQAWIETVTADSEYYGMLVAITAAVFGLGKLNGRK
jgi:hypothetical protein